MAKFDLVIVSSKAENGSIQLDITVPGKITADLAAGSAVALAMQDQIDLSKVEVGALVKTVIEQAGEARYREFVKQYTMTSLAPFAVVEQKLEIVMDPVTSSDEEFVEGADFHFRALVTAKPQYELSSYEPVTVVLAHPMITEGEIDEQLAAMAEHSARTEPVDDAWVAQNAPEAGTLAGLRTRIREQGLAFKTKQLDDRKYFLTATELAKRLVGHIPDEIYAYTHKEMLQNLQAQVEASGLSLKEFIEQKGIPEQQFSMQMMLETRERLRQSFSLDALVRHLQLTLTAEDIDEALARMAPGNEKAARTELEGTGRTYLLEEAALRIKANKWLVETATYEYRDS